MAFFEAFRFRRSQTTPATPTHPRFAPGWLAQNQRTAIRALAGALMISVGVNIYQMHLREKIPTTPPEIFTAVVDSTFTTVKVVNARDLKVDEIEGLATAEVRSLVHRLRRVADSAQLQENIDLLYCSVTGVAATKANRLLDRGSAQTLVKAGSKRILSQKDVRAGLRPGQRAREDGMWITANWTEKLDEGVRKTSVERTGEFHVQRFANISPQIRACNPNGMMIVDFELFDAD